jgi:hypothetical protein
MPSSSRSAQKEIRSTFISRLERLIRMRRDYREDLNPLGIRLLDRAIEATYQDCVDYGAGDRARIILAGFLPAGDGN